MNKLKSIILTEASLNDKITSRAKITYDALIAIILATDDGKITDKNKKEIADELDITIPTLERYIKQAVTNKFISSSGEVLDKYKKESTGKVKASGKVSQALNARVKKFKAPKVSSNNLFSEQVFKMLSLMDGQAAQAGVKNSLMLTGDPGTGKTSFIRNFAKLLGLPLIPIEAPHITEEHIINIPFMIIRGNKVKKENAIIETAGKANLDDKQEFDIVQAESNLVTKLKAMKNLKLKDQQHIASIASDKNLRPIYLNYKSLIDSIRDSYHCILFLDEYYRNDNMKIRNILRNILNGRIGNDKIPKGTFIVYASNMEDDGVEDIPMNNDFAEMEFKTPDREQWFKYILNKYEENSGNDYPGVKLQPEVFNKFYDVLEQSDLSYEDATAEVRNSPRRWEQILLYVNASLPVSNIKEARTLMSNLQVNFRNYTEETVSNLYPKFEKMVVGLIKETSGIEFDGRPTNQVDWKDTLQQQLEVKIKLDGQSDSEKEVRQYVPVVSGEPGIGKTAHMRTVADDLDLHFIHIDVSTLTRESTTGIPKASQATDIDGNPEFDQNGNPVMTTEFSKPELLDLIEKKMQEELAEDEMFPEDQRKKGKGKYRFLLLFDELTRADAQVFNAIRKLLLEKSFNEQYDLPKSIMTVGALNPVDNGAEELTKHMRDVLDIIPSRASWAKTESYLLSEERPVGLEEVMGFDLNTATVGALKGLLQQYQSKDEDWRGNPVSKEERLFNLRDGSNIIYISPREITDIVTMTNANIVNRLTKVGLKSFSNEVQSEEVDGMSDDEFMQLMMQQAENPDSVKEKIAQDKGIFNLRNRYSEEDYDVFIRAMINEFREAWASKLTFICKKMDIDAANVLSLTTGFISTNSVVYDQYEAIKTLVVDDVKNIEEMFDAYWDNPEELYDSPHFDNYLTVNFTAPQKFTQEITDYLSDKLVEIEQDTSTDMVTVESENGPVEIPKNIAKKMELFYKYILYTKSILKVLTDKSEYAGKVKEAQRTGQYLSNLHIALQMHGKDFMSKSGLLPYVLNKNLDADMVKKVSEAGNEIRTMLSNFGIKG